jgi:hypothetical protein
MRVKTGNRALFLLAGFVLAGLALAGCENEINSPYVQARELTLEHTTVMVRASESVTLRAALNPVNATNQKVKWVSDDEQTAVAAVDPADASELTAVITGKKLGYSNHNPHWSGYGSHNGYVR